LSEAAIDKFKNPKGKKKLSATDRNELNKIVKEELLKYR
jgi:flagellar basal body-associated protein FliL